MSSRILLVDDEKLSQDLIGSVLRGRGYSVDVVADGFSALRAVQKTRYDLAIVDYHMPDIDGYASARLLREALPQHGSPKIVGMSGDHTGLAGRRDAGEIFDMILAKSTAPAVFVGTIDQLLDPPERVKARNAARETWRKHGLADLPKAATIESPTAGQTMVLDLCFDIVAPEAAEVIIRLDPSAEDALSDFRANAANFWLPVIDFAGLPGADAAFDVNEDCSWSAIASLIRGAATRSGQLPAATRERDDADTRLLAYIFVSGAPFRPRVDTGSPALVRYPGFFASSVQSAERLTARGLLQPTFVDRYHACQECDSRRLNVREECISCRSPHIQEVDLIHHFQCATIAPEQEFRSGRDLMCPKCRQFLKYYGYDYDKPSAIKSCKDCGQSNSELAVGFVCQDCGAHTDGDKAPCHDVSSYALTSQGIRFLIAPVLWPGRQFARLPSALADDLRYLCRDTEAAVSVAEIVYGLGDQICETSGQTAFFKLRSLFIENLQNLVAGDGDVIRGAATDFLVVKGGCSQEARELAEKHAKTCEDALKEPVGAEIRVVDVHAGASS